METIPHPVAGVRLRRIRDTDAQDLERFYAELSDESRRYRFLAVTHGLSHAQSTLFCSPDHEHREGFVAVVESPETGRESIVGHLCLEPTTEGTLEMAIAVADDWQGHGIGRRLLLRGVEWARSVGIAEMRANAAATNFRIHRLVAGLDLPVAMRRDGEMTAIAIDLTGEPTSAERRAA